SRNPLVAIALLIPRIRRLHRELAPRTIDLGEQLGLTGDVVPRLRDVRVTIDDRVRLSARIE
ncbi:MAG: hypothetical protein ACTH31_02100, partial [Pseudoclavibacter sp.]